MMSPELIAKIRGAKELTDWFGQFPSFHDALVAEFQISGEGQGHLVAKAFLMTDRVDERGFYILDKQCSVTLRFSEIISVELRDFLPGQAILQSLEIGTEAEAFVVSWTSSYGFDGVIKTKRLSISHVPGE